MKHITVISTVAALILTSVAVANDCDVVSRSPLSQKSDWDIFCNDVLKGQIKFPPAELVETISENGQSSVLSAILPYGRSPEKNYTDMDNPRSLIYWQKGLGGSNISQSNKPRVTFGYTPNLKQLEVISFNINTGENEFRIVHDYDGKSRPRVEKVDSRMCMTCHQNNLPLFPVIPWTETQENPRVIQGLTDSKNHKKLDPFASYLIEENNFAKYHLNNIVDFDIVIKSDYFQNMKLCSQFCKNDDKKEEVKCQKNLLLSALTKAAELNSSITSEEANKVVVSLWNNFTTKNPIYRLQMDIEERENPTRPFKLEKGINLPAEDPLAMREVLSFARPLHIGSINYGLSCFRFSKENIREIGSNFAQNIREFQKSTALEMLTQHWVPNENILVKAFVNPKIKIEPAVESQNASAEMVNSQETQKIQNPQDLFYMSCIGCHHSEEALGGYLPLDDRQKLKSYVGAGGRTVEELLSNSISGKGRSMPPKTSPFYVPTEQQKKIMLEWVDGSRLTK